MLIVDFVEDILMSQIKEKARRRSHCPYTSRDWKCYPGGGGSELVHEPRARQCLRNQLKFFDDVLNVLSPLSIRLAVLLAVGCIALFPPLSHHYNGPKELAIHIWQRQGRE